jgi:hypothetical protein
MSTRILNSIVLVFGLIVHVINAEAQSSEAKATASAIEIESFSWYPKLPEPEMRIVRDGYNRGLPEGNSTNAPSSTNSSQGPDIPRFVYWIKIRNVGDQDIISVVWRYEFFDPLTKTLAARHEFESRSRIRPNKKKTLYAESGSPPTSTINIGLLSLNKDQPFQESATVRSLMLNERFRKKSRYRQK